MNNETLRRIKFYIKLLGRDLGLPDSHSDYDKFLILGQSRSGSNFLRSLLESHPQIFTYGELFRASNSIIWGRSDYNRYLQSPELLSLIKNNPIFFLEDKVFGKYPKKISAVGFKMFYKHAQSGSMQGIWDYFENQKDLKIIHLKRENLLRRCLSLKKAYLTNEWIRTTPNSEMKKMAITLTYEECLHDFLKTRENQEKYDACFKEHSKIELIYENILQDRESEMKRVQEFLNVGVESLQPSTCKQSYQPLSEEISNYFELKERFQSTPWESFFED